jgi:hypothetical protein
MDHIQDEIKDAFEDSFPPCHGKNIVLFSFAATNSRKVS